MLGQKVHQFKGLFVFISAAILFGQAASGYAQNFDFAKSSGSTVSSSLPKLDVVIPVFDPNIPTGESNDVWPEVRRAEANRFAYLAKQALDKTKAFGAVRVTPDDSMYGQLYVFGKILKANGEDVQIQVTVNDIRGKHTAKKWLKNKKFSYRVPSSHFSSSRNKGTDAYTRVFDEFAQALVQKLSKKKQKDLKDLNAIAEMVFAANMAPDKFAQHLKLKKSRGGLKISLKSMPAENDPLYQRVRSLRIVEQQFVDRLQANYTSYFNDSSTDYYTWQALSHPLVKELRMEKEKLDAELAAIITKEVVCGFTGICDQVRGQKEAVLARIAAALQLHQRKVAEMKENFAGADMLSDMGESLNMTMAPKNVLIEGVQVELQGDAVDHFLGHRDLLKDLYMQEITPNVQLTMTDAR
ncbi:MAG: hypothetical protein AAF607_02395 [Pseudomonadota bacterium]